MTDLAALDLAFEEMFAKERAAVFRALFLITGSPQEAEELMQDAFLKVWERWEGISQMESPVGYLFQVAFNMARSRLRRVKLAAKHATRIGPSEDPFEAADLHDAVVRALAGLSERQRMALVLTDLLDVSSADAARLLRVRASTVRSLASQGRAALRSTMEVDDG